MQAPTTYDRAEAQARAHEWRGKFEQIERRRISRELASSRLQNFKGDNELARQLRRMCSTMEAWLLSGAQGDPFS